MIEAPMTPMREDGAVAAGKLRRIGSEAAGWPLAVAAICFTLSLVRPPLTLDGYLDLVSGRLVAEHGVPHVDTLSVAAHGREWVDQQWLAQLLMYETSRVAGPIGLTFLLASLLAATYWIFTRLCVRLGTPPQHAARWALLAFLGSVGYAMVRAEMFSYVAFALTLAWLAEDARHTRFRFSFLWIIALLALWANLHGAVVLGVLLVSLYCTVRALSAAYRRVRRTAMLYIACGVASVATLFASPYGLSEAAYYRRIFSSSVLREYENEWTAPRLGYPFAWMTYVFAITSLVVVALALRRRIRPNVALLLATAITGAAAFHAMRYQPWFALAAGGLAAATLGRLRPLPPPLSPRFLRLGAVGLALVALVSAISAAGKPTSARETALARGALSVAARWTSTHPHSRILADESTSDRLLWWYPETAGRVAFDARLDFYEQASVREWFSYIFGPGVPTSLAGKHYDVYLASKSNRSLYAKLQADRCLTTIYADMYGIVAVRKGANRNCGAGSS
jgi:hypothetical protein